MPSSTEKQIGSIVAENRGRHPGGAGALGKEKQLGLLMEMELSRIFLFHMANFYETLTSKLGNQPRY